MTDYIHHTNNTIDISAGPLPRVWENVSGLNMLSDPELKPLGWLPVVYSGSASAFHTGPAGCQVGDAVTPDADSVTGTYSYKSLADCKEVKLAQLATYRYEQEIGGIAVLGVSVKTDRETQGILTSGYVKAKENSLYTIDSWKVVNGVWTTLDAATIIVIADAVEDHVQDCFDNEKIHTQGADGSGGINALTTQAAVDAYDITTGW